MATSQTFLVNEKIYSLFKTLGIMRRNTEWKSDFITSEPFNVALYTYVCITDNKWNI
jgi:hypothetical protein